MALLVNRFVFFGGLVLSTLFNPVVLGNLCAAEINADATFREAEAAFDKRQYDRVLNLIEPLTQDEAATPEFRRLKIRALTRSGRPTDAFREYGLLEAKLKRDDEPLLREVAIGLITAVLKDMREQMRGAGYTALKELESEEALPFFEDGLTDGSGLVRTLAVEGLGRLAKGRRSPYLKRALEDQAAMVRVAALKGLGRSGDTTAIALIEKYLKDKQPTVRVAAAGALARLDRSDGWTRLREAAKASNPDERAAAFRALGELQDKASASILEQGLSDTQPSVRGAAIMALAELGKLDFAGGVERLLMDPIPAVRASAAVGLGVLQAKRAIPGLKRLLSDTNAAVKAAAVDALLHLGVGYDEVAATVRELTQSQDPGIRASAAKALGRSQSETVNDAMGILRLLMNDPLPRPRIAAARALGHLEKAERSQLVKVVKGGLADQDEAVRATAGGALARILSRPGMGNTFKPK